MISPEQSEQPIQCTSSVTKSTAKAKPKGDSDAIRFFKEALRGFAIIFGALVVVGFFTMSFSKSAIEVNFTEVIEKLNELNSAT